MMAWGRGEKCLGGRADLEDRFLNALSRSCRYKYGLIAEQSQDTRLSGGQGPISEAR
jgi:hypothetical protein